MINERDEYCSSYCEDKESEEDGGVQVEKESESVFLNRPPPPAKSSNLPISS